jgi:hypothetical protein
LNKVDLPSANPEEVSDDIIDLLGCKLRYHASGKTGFVSKYIGRHHRKNSTTIRRGDLSSFDI